MYLHEETSPSCSSTDGGAELGLGRIRFLPSDYGGGQYVEQQHSGEDADGLGRHYVAWRCWRRIKG